MHDETIKTSNVICFDKQGRELWRINDILKLNKPTGNVDIAQESVDVLLVYSVLGMVFKIDIEKEELIEKTFLR